MSSSFVKHHEAYGWDWYLEDDERSSWVSPMVKERIESLEAENASLRELVRDIYEMAYPEYPSAFATAFADRMHELGMEMS